MLKPYEMSSVIIAGPNEFLENSIKELHRLKVLHIVEHSRNELADIGKPLESANRFSEILVKVRALISTLNIQKDDYKSKPVGLYDVEKGTNKLNEQVKALSEQLRKTEELISANKSLRNELGILAETNIPLEAFTTYKSLSYLAGYVKDKKYLHAIKNELSKITDKFAVFNDKKEKRIFAAFFVESGKKEETQAILQKYKFIGLNLAHIANLKGDAISNLKKIEIEERKNEKLRNEIKLQLDEISSNSKDFLLAADDFLSEQLEKAEAPLKFALTPSSFLIKGWVPNEELNNVIDKLNKATKNRIYVHFEPAKKHDNVPVKLKNMRLAKPFEFFIDLYSIPTYKEIDPTFFIFLTFPIFFGIMLGDVGYGALSILLFLFLKIKMPKARNFFNILILASFVTVIFGFLFGEFFGTEFIHPIISREHEMFKLLYIVIAIGVVHVNAGLILGIINEAKAHGFMHALYAKGSWILLQIGIALIVLSVTNTIKAVPIWLGIIFLVLSVLLLLKGEGIKGLIELPSILTNIMSYARLMAIGLSSVILAVIVNEQAGQFFHRGGFFLLIGILILVIGHAINFVLGLLGSFLHSLRLHYVEFFSKFFHGGAKKYQPFGLKE